MNKVYLEDTATLAFQPLINLSSSPFATLSSQAPLNWLNSELSLVQWGAFMHFYGPTRKLLKIGGLNIEAEDFLNIDSSHEKWHHLVAGYKNGSLDIQKQLFLVRLLFYLGFYEQGLQLCKKVDTVSSTLNETIWAKYLYTLGRSIYDPSNWSPIDFIQEVQDTTEKYSPFLFFHISLLFAKFFIRNSNDTASAQKWLNEASLLTKNLDLSSEFDLNLALVRLSKYKADLFFRLNKPEEAISLLNEACKWSDACTLKLEKSSSYHYLFQETKRRLLNALVLHYYQTENEEKALGYAQESVSIDPYCSYALLLAGKSSIKLDPILSRSYFEKASEYGILERPYAKQVLASQFESQRNLGKDLEAEAYDGDIFLIPQKSAKSSLKLPIEIPSLGKIVENYSEDSHWEKIKEHPVYQRLLPFWELKLSHIKTPIFAKEPLVAFDVFNRKEHPWFKTLYLQRAMPVNFREELLFAVAPHIAFASFNQSHGTRLETLQNRSERCNSVMSTYGTMATMPKLERILFCRLLGALGFYEEALRCLPKPKKNFSWDFEDEYAVCTRLFLEHIYFAGTDYFLHQDMEFAYEKLSQHPESLRMRLVLTMLGCVFHGKRKQIQIVKKWRERGFRALTDLQNSDRFDEFEKRLLTSRFYRAASFYPFLTQDRETLRKEGEICETYARSLTACNEKQQLLFKENLFPMLESMARIFDFLGEQEKSLTLMEEIVQSVDAYDAKAWIQVGEAREKRGDLEKALEAFQIAIDLGAPLGAIACYRAGRTCEKMGSLNEAKHYYIRSLKFCPKGLSPLKRLNVISNDLNDFYMKNWSELNLSNLKTHFSELPS